MIQNLICLDHLSHVSVYVYVIKSIMTLWSPPPIHIVQWHHTAQYDATCGELEQEGCSQEKWARQNLIKFFIVCDVTWN